MAEIIPKHGGYRRLKSFLYAQLVYDITVRFCNRYIDKRSRTNDQMVQAARSGVQNIADGSQASGTSKKTELKLTNVARASLEELKLDYEDFLRQRNFPSWERDNPFRQEVVDKRFKNADEVALWIKNTKQEIERKSLLSSSSSESPMSSSLYPTLSANTALTLIEVACYLLDRQIKRLADDFEKEGGFTEKLYKVRTDYKKRT
ncbi:MAG: four helix bundle protein [Candidatus Cloacimonetes bacterium]|nr:four helix bundle protein [Candidatus Cloacimonadota bacterium]